VRSTYWLCCTAALAGLLSSVTPTTPLPPNTPQLADLNGLFSTGQPVGHQLLGASTARDSSPISAAVAAAGLLGGPQSCKLHTVNECL